MESLSIRPYLNYALKGAAPATPGKGRFLMRLNLPDIEQIRTLPRWGRSSDLFFVVETTELEGLWANIGGCYGMLNRAA